MRLIADLSILSPTWGLAADEVLLEETRRSGAGGVRLWINDRAIIVGRAQAIEDEVDVALATREGVPYLRRLSGGGAVFHHPGNLNVTICVPESRSAGNVEQTFLHFGGRIAEGLREWAPGVKAEGNRLTVRGRKLAGAAQIRRSGAVLYHTTVLVDEEALPMAAFLLAHRPGYVATNVASRPERLTTLSTETRRTARMDDVSASIRRSLSSDFDLRGGSWSDEEAQEIERLARDKYGEALWIWRRRAIAM